MKVQKEISQILIPAAQEFKSLFFSASSNFECVDFYSDKHEQISVIFVNAETVEDIPEVVKIERSMLKKEIERTSSQSWYKKLLNFGTYILLKDDFYTSENLDEILSNENSRKPVSDKVLKLLLANKLTRDVKPENVIYLTQPAYAYG